MSATVRVLPSQRPELLDGRARPGDDETQAVELLERYRRATWSGARILEIPPRRWLASGWLPLDGVQVLYGPPGCGKSYLALSVALEVARGGTWAGERLEAASVLYVAAERATDLRDRLEAWSVHHDAPIPERLHVLAPDAVPQLATYSELEALTTHVRELEPRVVVLDTLARMTVGREENSARDMGEAAAGLDAIRRATSGGLVIVVHHSGKDATRGLRGSTALLGAVDHVIELAPHDRAIRATVTKSNGGAPPPATYYELSPVDLDPTPGDDLRRSGAVLVEIGTPDASAAGQAHARDGVRELLRTSYPDGASRRELREGLANECEIQLPDSSVGKVLTHLQRTGELERIGSGRSTRWRLTVSGLPLD